MRVCVVCMIQVPRSPVRIQDCHICWLDIVNHVWSLSVRILRLPRSERNFRGRTNQPEWRFSSAVRTMADMSLCVVFLCLLRATRNSFFSMSMVSSSIKRCLQKFLSKDTPVQGLSLVTSLMWSVLLDVSNGRPTAMWSAVIWCVEIITIIANIFTAVHKSAISAVTKNDPA